MTEMFDDIRENIGNFFKKRLNPLMIVYVLLLVILVNRMFTLQIARTNDYEKAANGQLEHTKEIKATRGNIYDCNGKLLATNKLSYNVSYENYSQSASSMTSDEKNAMIYRLIRLIESNGDKIDVDFFMEYDKDGKLKFTAEGNNLLFYKSEVFAVKNGIKGLTEKQRDMSAKELYDYMRDTPSAATTSFGISDKYSKEDTLKIMSVRYAMFSNRYSYDPVTIAKNVSRKTVAAIKENSDELPGIDITTASKRVYKHSKYFAHILGYTGIVTSEKQLELKAEDKNSEYTADDQIGISGLEEEYEDYLKGKKGKEKITVDSETSRVASVEAVQNPVAGNDIYLTIDADLQKKCYDILEKHIAAILVSKITNSSYAGTRGSSSKDIYVPIYDVYNALLNNNVINTSRFTDKDASQLEKDTYRKFKDTRKDLTAKLLHDIGVNSHVTSKEAGKYRGEFIDYFYTYLKENNYILTDKVKTSSQMYKDYESGKAGLSEYLQYAISNNWMDLSKLNIGNDYYSTEEIYKKLLNQVSDELKDDNGYTKMVYSYLIYHYSITGRDCCLLLFDQGDIKYDPSAYKALKSGTLSPYSFIISKIKKLEITPGQLGLDPCSGSVVVTDVNTGKVKAMVSYPSYDNNRMANQVDSDYFYTYLTQNSSSPLLNRPTMQKLAPGSTFKIVSAVTGLQEGVISPGTTIYDRTVFDKIKPSPRDWSSVSHGNINVSQAIEMSCNYFFYTVGYDLGLKNGHLDSDYGLSRIKKYADMFGLTAKSGVEIPETSPHFSDTDVVRSAIGQGTHSYTPSQISRYVTTVANSGTCYNLTLIDHINSVKGKTVFENKTAPVRNKVNISKSTWDAVHKGMYLVVNGPASEVNSYFTDIKQTIAGKTGTAQQTSLHANHAYFMSYAPYQDPKVSVTCVIPNGYASSNAAYTASDIYRYYFCKDKKKYNDKSISANKNVKVTD